MASVCWSLQCLISALTQAGGGGFLFRLLVPSRCGEGLVLLSPTTLLRLPAVLHGAGPALRVVPALGVPQKCGTRSPACFLCLPSQSDSGSQELDRRTLPGRCAPSPLHGPSLSFHLCQSGACTFCPPHPQPQFPSTPVGCLRPVSPSDPPSGYRPSRISGGL